MNNWSSRGHSIFTVTVESEEVGEDGNPQIRKGILKMVDLASMERLSLTCPMGLRFEEAKSVNSSLSSFSQVVSTLTGKKNKHVPYRSSKLTYLLKDSLGEKSKGKN